MLSPWQLLPFNAPPLPQTSPDYDHLMLLQKVEVFEHAIESTTSGDDLARVLWLNSPSSEVCASAGRGRRIICTSAVGVV